MSRAPASPTALITELCASHPDRDRAPHPDGAGATHECLADEMLSPYPCHSCGKFLSARRMHDAASGEMPHICEECLP